LPVVADGYTDNFPGVWKLVLFALALLILLPALVLAWFAVNRPSKTRSVQSQGLVPTRLRQAQGFFSNWVEVGSQAKLNHNALPAQALRIRSTRFGGTVIEPRVTGFKIGNETLKSGQRVVWSPTSSLVYQSSNSPAVTLKLS
jgi:hypothetical protein